MAPAEAKSLSLHHFKVHVNPTEIRSVLGLCLTKKEIKYDGKLLVIHLFISAVLVNISQGHFWR